MSNVGNTLGKFLYQYPGNPTNVSLKVLDPPRGAIVVDPDSGDLWRKTSQKGDNSGYSAIGGSGGVTLTGVETLTNKRITPRTATVASSATPTINTDTTDLFTITAQAAAITSFTTNLSGTPTEGQKLMLRILDNGNARAITHGASFRSLTGTLLTTTTAGKISYEGFIWNAVDSIWDCLASGTQA